MNSIPNKGIGFGVLVGYNDVVLPLIKFNYLGHFREIGKTEDNSYNFWSITDEEAGIFEHPQNVHSNHLTINSIIINNQLKIEFSGKFSADTITNVKSSFRDSLSELSRMKFLSEKHEIETMTDFEPFIELNPDQSPLLFIFPPGAGGAESYMGNLVPHLKDFRLILFNNFANYLKEVKNVNLPYEDLAKEYIKVLKSLDPTGPYNFCGWSFGGVLAFEVSRQLTEGGNRVSVVTIIDSFIFTDKALLDLGIDSTDTTDQSDIYYSYRPPNSPQLSLTKFILFKACVPTEYQNGYRGFDDQRIYLINKMRNYFVKDTESNNWETLLPAKEILQVLLMQECSHDSWTNDEVQIKCIADSLKNLCQK